MRFEIQQTNIEHLSVIIRKPIGDARGFLVRLFCVEELAAAGWLALEIAKARTVLGVQPLWSLVESVQRTIHWYRQQHEGADARSLCEADIHDMSI